MIWYMTRSTWQLMQFKAGKKKWIISSVQWPGDVVPTWARVVHGLSTWNPDFNLTCGHVYKEKSRGKNFPTSVFPGFSYLLLPDICLLWTPPNFLLFYFVIMRESAPTRMQADAQRKNAFSCPHVHGRQGLWGNSGIIFPNFAVWIWFLWASPMALLSQIPTTPPVCCKLFISEEGNFVFFPCVWSPCFTLILPLTLIPCIRVRSYLISG